MRINNQEIKNAEISVVSERKVQGPGKEKRSDV